MLIYLLSASPTSQVSDTHKTSSQPAKNDVHVYRYVRTYAKMSKLATDLSDLSAATVMQDTYLWFRKHCPIGCKHWINPPAVPSDAQNCLIVSHSFFATTMMMSFKKYMLKCSASTGTAYSSRASNTYYLKLFCPASQYFTYLLNYLYTDTTRNFYIAQRLFL